ncbi:hypothetical protein CDAR_175621 [Caerostris darwini]|uniref:Uncharacterized protein n=1 Tax=Caerostris darwini TaxID=1538125 RepID=A0AAV4X3F1_9ARAC|nr:hypothetical protein CDAR_175621 [Caerostris darwini]
MTDPISNSKIFENTVNMTLLACFCVASDETSSICMMRDIYIPRIFHLASLKLSRRGHNISFSAKIRLKGCPLMRRDSLSLSVTKFGTNSSCYLLLFLKSYKILKAKNRTSTWQEEKRKVNFNSQLQERGESENSKKKKS